MHALLPSESGLVMIHKERADVIERVKQLDQAVLLPVVREVLSDDSVSHVPHWTTAPIGTSIGTGTLGIFKVSGEVETDSGKKRWSAVAKVMDLGATSDHAAHQSPDREITAYESGLLAQIGSQTSDSQQLRAAKHYGTHILTNMGTILWVEDLSGAPPIPWDDETFLEIARQVGRFNGYWELNPPERQPWFLDDFMGAEIGSRLQRYAAIDDYLDDPMVQISASAKLVEYMATLPTVIPEAISLLDAGPRTLAHLDAQPRNIFPMQLESGGFETVAIDWASIGYAPLGTDGALVIGSSMTWHNIDAAHGVHLHSAALEKYLTGLEESGWSGNFELVRLAYMTAAVNRAAGNAMFTTMWVDEPEWRPHTIEMMGKPADVLVPHWRDVFEGVYPLFMKELAAV